MMMVVMMVVMMPVVPRSHPNGDAAMMMVVMMADHHLGGPDAACLGEPRIIGFQEWHRIGDRIEKIAIARGLREFRPAHGRCLGGSQRRQGRRRSQQPH
jgi:hypothetical protein